MAFYEDLLNGLVPQPRPSFGSLALPMAVGASPVAPGPSQPAPQSVAPASPKPQPYMPEQDGFDSLSTFLAGMSDGGGALLPALGAGSRAVSAEKERRARVNQTYEFLVQKGKTPDEAKMIMSNPDILRAELSAMYAPKVQSVAPGNVMIDQHGKVVFDNREAVKPTNDIIEYEYAKKQGYAGTLNDFIRSKQSQSVGQQTPDERAALASKYGFQPDSDAYKAFVLTGKLPREDQQMLTATDKKAILEADELVSSTQSAIQNLHRALDLSSKAYDGATANERAWFTSQFGSEAGNATRELNQAITETALQQLKAIFGGAPTEGERKILLDIQGSAELPQRVRDNIIQKAIGMAERRLSFNKQRAEQLRGGTFYKPQAEGGPQPAPSGVGGAPIRAKNDKGDVIEWNGQQWVPVQ